MSPKMGIPFVDFKTLRIPRTTQGTGFNIGAQSFSSSSPLIGWASVFETATLRRDWIGAYACLSAARKIRLET